MSSGLPLKRMTRRESKLLEQGKRMSNYKLKRTNTLSVSLEASIFAPDNDVTQLKDLTEKSLLTTIKNRFLKESIYTFAGSILISVNPYYSLPIYNPKYVKLYQGVRLHDLPPHVFAIADAAYQDMLKEGRNQCVIIGGESGSGKTEATKFLLQHLTSLSGMLLPQDILDYILFAGPILEAFGNATTLHNHNSSRFGKYVTLCFNENGTCRGAYIEKYLLEQCRLVTQEDGERNFHVFYYLLSGASDELKEELFLNSNTQYDYLSRKSNIIPSKQDTEGFTRLCKLLTALRLDERVQFNIFTILSAILHLGNLKFKHLDITAVLDSSTLRELHLVSELLKVPQELLTQTLTNRQKTVGGEKILIPCTYDQMVQTRDSLSKALYSSLFDWILFRINDILKGRIAATEPGIHTIGILDIFGFENVRNNSFEQFCINYANEQLHHHFMDFVLKAEQEEYINDKIEWKHIPYKDNTGCINLFSKRPKGLFTLINDESTIPRGSDASLYERFVSTHKNNSYFKTPQLKHLNPNFSVTHFAGIVTYHINQFTEKNKDLMSHSVIELLQTSDDCLVRELIGVEPIGRMKWRKLGMVFRAVQNFKSSLSTRLSPSLELAHNRFHPNTLTIPNSNFKQHETFHEEHVVSKSSEPYSKNSYNKREVQGANCIRFINSYTPTESPKRSSSRRRSKRAFDKLKPKPADSKPRFTSFDVQEMRGAPTVVSQFQTSLQNLLVQLSSANPFFIKCIRSNATQQPRNFNEEVVKYQLNYSGLFEAIKVRQAGYSIRMPFQTFILKYQPLIKYQRDDVRHPNVIVSDFLKQQYLPPNSYQVGKTKVFIQEDEGLCLDEQLNSVIMRRIVFLQKSVRIWLARRRNARFRQSIIIAQAYSKGYLLRSFVQRQLTAIINIQSAWRGHATRRYVIRLKKEASLIRSKNHRQCLRTDQYSPKREVSYIPPPFPPGQQKLSQRKSLFEGIESSYPKSEINPKTNVTLTLSGSGNFRNSYMEALQSQQYKTFASRDNDSSKFDLGKVKRKYEDLVVSPNRLKSRSSSVDFDRVRPGSVNEMVRDLETDKHPMHLQGRSSRTLSRYSFFEPTDSSVSSPRLSLKSPVSYSRSYDFNTSNFTPRPPPRTPPRDIFTKLIKSHCHYLNNLPLERETIFKQNSSLHLSNNSRFNAEMFQEKLISPLPTNYNHVKVKRSRAKPVVRREAIRVVSPSIDRPYLIPCSPLASANNFFPKVVHDDDNSDGYHLPTCVMSPSHIPKRKKDVDLVKVKSLADISTFELTFDGKTERGGSSPSFSKSSLSLTQSVDSKHDYSDLRRRAITVSTLNPSSKGLSRSLHMGTNKNTESPLHSINSVQNKLYSLASSPFRRDKLRKDKRDRNKCKSKGGLISFAHGHEPKQYLGGSFQKVPCNRCLRILHPPFQKGKVYRCALCNQIFHENCMPFAKTCPSSSGDIVIARNISDLTKLASFLLDKKEALSDRDRPNDTMDAFYILALERMHANLLASTSLRAQAMTKEALLTKTQSITIRNMLHDFSLLLTPIVSDTKSQIMLRNVFMNLLEDYLIDRSREDLDPNSTVPIQATKVLQRRKEIQKPKLLLGHTFLEKHFNVLTVCETCEELMSLVEPGQYCQACDYVCHKSCLSHLKVTCSETSDECDTKSEKVFGIPLNCLTKSHTGLPLVFELCLKSIESTGMITEGIYRKSSVKSKVTRLIGNINDDLETLDWESYDVHAICSALKTFLNELPDPLLTFDVYDKCIIAAKINDRAEKLRAVQAILQLLPPINYDCFERLVFHMAQICQLEQNNKMSPQSLAIVFAPVLLRSPEDMPLIELAKVVPLQTLFIQVIIEEHLKKFRDTIDDMEQLDRDRRNTIRKIKQITQDDSKSDSGIFDQAVQEDPTTALRWRQLNTQLADIESQKFSLTVELARLDLRESSTEDSSSHDSMDAMI